MGLYKINSVFLVFLLSSQHRDIALKRNRRRWGSNKLCHHLQSNCVYLDTKFVASSKWWFQGVTYSVPNHAQGRTIAIIGRELVPSTWYGHWMRPPLTRAIRDFQCALSTFWNETSRPHFLHYNVLFSRHTKFRHSFLIYLR